MANSDKLVVIRRMGMLCAWKLAVYFPEARGWIPQKLFAGCQMVLRWSKRFADCQEMACELQEWVVRVVKKVCRLLKGTTKRKLFESDRELTHEAKNMYFVALPEKPLQGFQREESGVNL